MGTIKRRCDNPALGFVCGDSSPCDGRRRYSLNLLLPLFVRSMLVGRIDGDKDGFVTTEEMTAWIKYTQRRWMIEEVDRQFKTQDLDGDGLITWEEYKNATYGYTMGTTTQCRHPRHCGNPRYDRAATCGHQGCK